VEAREQTHRRTSRGRAQMEDSGLDRHKKYTALTNDVTTIDVQVFILKSKKSHPHSRCRLRETRVCLMLCPAELSPSAGRSTRCRSTENSIPVPDLSAIDDPAATQPKLIKYPQTLFGQKKRSSAAHWYDKYTFLEYSISKDSVFCKMCRHFSERRGRRRRYILSCLRDLL